MSYFYIDGGATYFQKNQKESFIFGDFYMKIIGEITEGGFWVCVFGAKVLGRLVERRIVLHPSAFDSRVKFLEKTRRSFGGGAFNLSEGGLLERYHSSLKEDYYRGVVRRYHAADCVGQQTLGKGYWCLSSEIHIHDKKMLAKEQQRYLFLDDSLKAFEVTLHRHLVEDREKLCSVSKRFIQACNAFLVNTTSMKLATAFVLSRLLKVNNEETWNESSIAMLHSPLSERNVGKSLTLDILSKAQGVPSRRHPTMLAGGDQSQSGTSVPVLRDTLSRTNLVVMVDDPVFSAHLGEFIVNLQSGLMMGSKTAGVTTPCGSLLLTSNDNVLPRAEGRVLIFNYVRGLFSSNDDQSLDRDLKALVNENVGFLLAWAVIYKEAWEDNITTFFGTVKDVLSEILPEMQPRWLKGMATVILTYAIFHASVGISPQSVDLIKEVLRQNKMVKKLPLIIRLQQSLTARLEDAKSNALGWLNPAVNVSVNGKFVPAVGIRTSVVDDFAQVTSREVIDYLSQSTDTTKSVPVVFAIDDSCNLKDIQSRTNGKIRTFKGVKVPKSLLQKDVLAKIEEHCGISKGMSDKAEAQPITSSSTAGSHDANPSNTEDMELIATKITEMDESILSYFKGYHGTTCSQGNQALPDNFSLSLSPGSRKEYDECSPHSKTMFKKGFALARRMLQKQDRAKPADNTAETPCSSSKSSGDQPPLKRRLFPEGTIGVFPRQGTSKSPRKESDNEESEVCHVCGQQSPAKKKNWSRQWIACDTCKSWTHLECSKRQRLPTNDEPFQCTSCEKSSKQ